MHLESILRMRALCFIIHTQHENRKKFLKESIFNCIFLSPILLKKEGPLQAIFKNTLNLRISPSNVLKQAYCHN